MTNRSRDRREGCSTPPPVGDGKSGVPVGRGLKKHTDSHIQRSAPLGGRQSQGKIDLDS